MIDRVTIIVDKEKFFFCGLCQKTWPIELATVDHDPDLGAFANLTEFGDWIIRCFTGYMRAICKPCHKKKPKAKRRIK